MSEREETIKAIREFCRKQSPASVQISSDGIERIYYAGLSLEGLADALLAAPAPPLLTAQVARVPKVRTSHHRNKEEATRLQALVAGRYAAPAPPATSREGLPPTQEYFLRAMAANYAGGHSWDHLDGMTCTMAADEIAALRQALAQLQPADAGMREGLSDDPVYDQKTVDALLAAPAPLAAAREACELADQIEGSEGLLRIVPGQGTVQLGIKRTAMVIAALRAQLQPADAGMREGLSDEMIEDGCRGMYGKNWDGPPDKAPGEDMKNVWRKYSRNCLTAALATQEKT